MARFLALLDTDRIKEYVFATNNLKEIRGASAILDKLNLETTFQMLSDLFGEGNYLKSGLEWKYNCKTMDEDQIPWEVIFLGGGSGKVIFSDEYKAERFRQAIKEAYRLATDNAASITAVTLERMANEPFKHWVYRGEKKLRKQKDSRNFRLQPITSQYFKICESTGLFPAEEISRGDGIPICRASNLKRADARRSRSYFAQFKMWLDEPDQREEDLRCRWKRVIDKDVGGDDEEETDWDRLLPQDISAIGKLSDNYVGLIYADGNRMGERLSALEELSQYRILSHEVRHGTRKAMFGALASNLKIVSEDDCLPFEILLLGGDDLIALVPANKAVEIAKDFCERFTNYTNISICAGVVIAHAKYPIYRMIDYGEELLKSAKSLSNQIYRIKEADVNAVDFMVMKGASLQSLGDVRETQLSYFSDYHRSLGPDLILYQRPYTTKDLGKLISWIRRFKASNFPRTKLRAMYESLYRGKGQAMMDYLTIASRLPRFSPDGESPRDVMMAFRCEWDDGMKLFPWKKKEDGRSVTPLVDLIDLYDFID